MRYIIDVRVGCCAVVDTRHPAYDPEYQGLHPDTGGVVEFWMGKRSDAGIWELPTGCVLAATEMAQKLNGEKR